MRGPLGRIYDATIANAGAIYKAVRRRGPSKGERQMTAISGGVGSSSFPGAWSTEKTNQVQQFNNWLSSCIRYKARLVGTCPRAVRIATSAEREKTRREYEIQRKVYLARPHDYPPPRHGKWLSVIARKSAVSPDKARDSEELEHLDDDHPLSRLLADPNEPDVGLVFWPYFAAFYFLCGESFIWKVRDGSGDVVEMWVLPAHWVTPRSDGKRFFAYYEVRAWGSGGSMEEIDAADIIHWRSPGLTHPASPFSETQAAASVIDTHAMIQWVRYSLLQNGAQIGGVLELPEGVSDIGPDAMNRLLAKFQSQFSGVWNSGRPLIVPGGGSYTHPPANLELALGESETLARQNVMAAFGLDESLMGFANESTYAAASVTWKRLRKAVVEPDQKVLAAVLTERLATEFGEENAIIYPDEGGLEDPAEKRANWQAAMQNPSGSAVTLNEIRVELLGLEPSEEKEADKLYGSPGMVPLDQMGAMNDLSGMLGEGDMGAASPEGFGMADDFLADDPTDADDGEGKKKAATLPSPVWSILAAALIDLRIEAGEDSPDEHEPESDALLALATDPKELAEILRGAIDDDDDTALESKAAAAPKKPGKSGVFTDSAGRRYRLENGKRVPLGQVEGSKPGETHVEKPKADKAKARALLGKVGSGKASAADLRAFADHLPALTIPELRQARQHLSASFGGARRKEAMVAALREHAKSKVSGKAPGKPDAVKPAAKPAAKPKADSKNPDAGKAKSDLMGNLNGPGGIVGVSELRTAYPHLSDEQLADGIGKLSDAGKVTPYADMDPAAKEGNGVKIGSTTFHTVGRTSKEPITAADLASAFGDGKPASKPKKRTEAERLEEESRSLAARRQMMDRKPDKSENELPREPAREHNPEDFAEPTKQPKKEKPQPPPAEPGTPQHYANLYTHPELVDPASIANLETELAGKPKKDLVDTLDLMGHPPTGRTAADHARQIAGEVRSRVSSYHRRIMADRKPESAAKPNAR